jgi:hypothetical protein
MSILPTVPEITHYFLALELTHYFTGLDTKRQLPVAFEYLKKLISADRRAKRKREITK